MGHVPLDRHSIGVKSGSGTVRAEMEGRLAPPLELGHAMGGGNQLQ